jgi:hypothetical protein
VSKNKGYLNDIRQKLNVNYMQINIKIIFHVLTVIEWKCRSHLSKTYPTDVGKYIVNLIDLILKFIINIILL